MTSPKMADRNNVYGHFIAPQGLQPILRAMMPLVGEKRAYIYTSQFDGAETLHISTDTAEFESTPLEAGSRHLLNGCVAGILDNVVGFVRSMSGLLTEAGIEHQFEVYDADEKFAQMVPR